MLDELQPLLVHFYKLDALIAFREGCMPKTPPLNPCLIFLIINFVINQFYGHHHELVDRCKISKSQMTMDLFFLHRFVFLLTQTRLLMNLARYKSIMTGTAYPSWAHGFTRGIWWGQCCSSIFSFLCCALLIFFVFVLCLVRPLFPMSLDCPFLIAHFGFL